MQIQGKVHQNCVKTTARIQSKGGKCRGQHLGMIKDAMKNVLFRMLDVMVCGKKNQFSQSLQMRKTQTKSCHLKEATCDAEDEFLHVYFILFMFIYCLMQYKTAKINGW